MLKPLRSNKLPPTIEHLLSIRILIEAAPENPVVLEALQLAYRLIAKAIRVRAASDLAYDQRMRIERAGAYSKPIPDPKKAHNDGIKSHKKDTEKTPTHHPEKQFVWVWREYNPTKVPRGT